MASPLTERRYQSWLVACRLTKEIGSFVTDEVPDSVWQAVSSADHAHNKATAAWVRSGSKDDLATYKRTHDALVEKWREFAT